MFKNLLNKVQLHRDRMPGNKYDNSPTYYSSGSRVERLLRDREIRKNSRASHSNETTENNKGTQPFDPDVYLNEDDNSRISSAEYFPEGDAVPTINNEGCEKQDVRPIRQRLLVVANRLPVSAVRRGEDSWSLEISAGGLVSALLGTHFSI